MAKYRKYDTPAALQKKVNEYFAACDKKKRPYTITGLTLYLKYSIKGLWVATQKDDAWGEILQNARLRIEDYLVHRVLTEKSVAGPIFILKASFGYRETSGLEHSGDLNVTFRWLTDGDPDSVSAS